MTAVRHLAMSGLDVFAHNIETVAGLQVCLICPAKQMQCYGVTIALQAHE